MSSTTDPPPGMSPSQWRLWCCCRPEIPPPSSAPVSSPDFDEFDPDNRLSTSNALYVPPEPPPRRVKSAPQTSGNTSSPHSQPIGTPRDRASTSTQQERPMTVLLPVPQLRRVPRFSPETMEAHRPKQPPPPVPLGADPNDQRWWRRRPRATTALTARSSAVNVPSAVCESAAPETNEPRLQPVHSRNDSAFAGRGHRGFKRGGSRHGQRADDIEMPERNCGKVGEAWMSGSSGTGTESRMSEQASDHG